MKYAATLFVIIFLTGFLKIEASECFPGEIKHDSCNICTCDNGVFICNTRLCVIQHHAISRREAINPKFNAILARFRRDTPAIAAELKTTPCAPNDYFQIDCNTCYCNFDRTGYLCTENTCVDGHMDTSTTTHIPMSRNAVLIISDDRVQLLENYNSNDNNLSRIGPDQQQRPNTSGSRQRPRNDLQNDLGSVSSRTASPRLENASTGVDNVTRATVTGNQTTSTTSADGPAN